MHDYNKPPNSTLASYNNISSLSDLYTMQKDSSETLTPNANTVVPPGQSAVTSIYRVRVAGHSRLVTITWCKNLLLHGLSVTIDQDFKLHLKPWYFWRKTGSKNITVDGTDIHLFWDLRDAVFDTETEPRSGFYVAVVSEGEVVLLEGDRKKDAYRRTRCRPSLVEPTLVSRTEHVFMIKRRFSFSTAVRVVKNGKVHRVGVGCKFGDEGDQSMEIWVDGCRVVKVEKLQWKFRGNECRSINVGTRLDMCWDVHDWMFGSSPLPRHGVFVFRAVSEAEEPPNCWVANDVASGFCLLVHAWRID